jgi:hypothetical protein
MSSKAQSSSLGRIFKSSPTKQRQLEILISRIGFVTPTGNLNWIFKYIF